MNKLFLSFVIMLATLSSFAGATGIVVKGCVKTWDEIARLALKASGKSISDDAVRAASKTVEKAAANYGDEVAEGAIRSGLEVAEASLAHGNRFVDILRKTATCSDDAVRRMAVNADDVVKYTARYGDDAVAICAKSPGIFVIGAPSRHLCQKVVARPTI